MSEISFKRPAYSAYGAFELKATYQRNLTLAMFSVLLFSVVLTGVGYAVLIIRSDAGGTTVIPQDRIWISTDRLYNNQT